MSDNDRSWHLNFEAYAEFITNHPNYKGLYFSRGKDNKVKWVVTGKSQNGQIRKTWWDKKCLELNIPIKNGCYAIVARKIHPTKKHVCQCCGKELSIYYEYPSKNLLKKLNVYFSLNLNQTDYTVSEFIEHFCVDAEALGYMASIFSIISYSDKADLIKKIFENHAEESKMLSPGVMSNSPDRFDGFHSDGLCCREKTDLGRHKDNMSTYTQDRRAYEDWSDGNFNLANRLMGEFHKCKKRYVCPICGTLARMSPDHIGPISLGFCHSTHFAPMCQACNSAKNNRFTAQDIATLISIEERGEQVVSWHSRYIWDKLKYSVKTDTDAKRLSSIMSRCHQNVLKLFSIILANGGEDYLKRFLHPEYAFFDYRFENFDPLNLETLVIKEVPLESKNKQKNSERYVRIAFESLREFDEKENRRCIFYTSTKDCEFILKEISLAIHVKDYSKADELLKGAIMYLCDNVEKEGV